MAQRGYASPKVPLVWPSIARSAVNPFEPDLDLVRWGSRHAEREARWREAERRGYRRWRTRGLLVLVGRTRL